MAAAGAIRAGNAFVELAARDGKLYNALDRAQGRLEVFAARARATLGLPLRVKGEAGAIASLRRFEGNLQAVRARVSGAGDITLRVGVAGVFGLGAMIRSLATAASEANEIENRFAQVLGDQAGNADRFVSEMANAVGRSTTKLKGELPAFFALFQGAKIDPAVARELSQQMLGLAVDFGSFQEMSDEDAIGKFISALGGSGEVLERYGINIKDAALKQEALTKGWDPKALTEQEKLLLRVSIIQRRMAEGGLTGDATRTAAEYANVLKRLKDNLFDAAAAAGRVLLPVLTPIAKAFATAVAATTEWIRKNQPLVSMIGKLVVGAFAGSAALIAVGGALKVAAFAAGGLGLPLLIVGKLLALVPAGISLVATAVGGLGSVLAVAAGLITGSMGGVVLAVIGAGAAILYASGLASYFGEAWTSATETAGRAWRGVVDAIKAGDLEAAVGVVTAGVRLVWARLTTDLTAAWVGFATEVADRWDGLITGIVNGAAFAAASVQRWMRQAAGSLQRGWQDAVAGAAKMMGEAYAAIDPDFDADEFTKILSVNLQADQKRSQDAETRSVQDTDQALSLFLQQNNQNRDDDAAARRVRADDRLAGLEQKRLEAEQRMTDAVGRASDARDAAEADAARSDAGGDAAGGEAAAALPATLEELLAKARSALAGSSGAEGVARGGFNASLFAQFGSQSGADPQLTEIARHTKDTADATRRIEEDDTRRGGLRLL